MSLEDHSLSELTQKISPITVISSRSVSEENELVKSQIISKRSVKFLSSYKEGEEK